MAIPAIIGIDTWKSWQSSGTLAQLIDVRSSTEFASGHIPGAVNIPLEQVELRAADLATTVPVVLVCQAGTRAHLAAKFLRASRQNLVVLEGGTGAWINAGNPVVRSTPSRWALERQVRLIAGLLVITGIALGFSLSPWFLGLSAFVGCGLAFAGASNICLMGEVLLRLPWNRIETRTAIIAGPSPLTDSTHPPALSCPSDQPKNA